MAEKMKNGIQKRGDTYYICYRLGGKPKWESCKGMSFKEAEELLAERKHAIKHGALTSTTVPFERLVDQWLGAVRITNVKPTTYAFYGGIAKHLKEYFAGVTDVKSIGTAEIEGYMEAKLKKLSPKTVGYHLGVLKMIFAKAVAYKYVTSNPCDTLKRPKCETKDIQLLNEDQVEEMKIHASDQTALIIQVAYETGLRAGEICGLHWVDVDLGSRMLDIHQNYTHGQLGTPKSRGSKRKVPFTAQLADDLKRWKEQATGELVFHNNGEYIEWTNFLHSHWSKLIKKLELPKAKFIPYATCSVLP